MRFIPVILLLATIPVFAQTPANQGRVLKALPLDFEETQPPTETAAPAQALPAEPVASPALPAETVATETPAAPSIDEKPTGDDAVRLQIFLDQSNFGPGVIDGRIGQFSELAVNSWNENQGHPIDSWRAVNTAARKAVPNPFAVAIVPEAVAQWVNPNLSYKKAEQAKAKREQAKKEKEKEEEEKEEEAEE